MSIEAATVYCSSSDAIDDRYVRTATTLGRLFAENGISLVYGGGNVGLMGHMARTVHEHDGHVVGVIPKAMMKVEGVGYRACDELYLTETMRERKRIMYERGDAYVALAGGFGTLEEFLEVLTLRQLRYHDRPVVLLNTDGFYDTLLSFFGELETAGFAGRKGRPAFEVVAEPTDVIRALGAGTVPAS